jgi:hypothetical protein
VSGYRRTWLRDEISRQDNIEFGLLLQGVPAEEIPKKRDGVAVSYRTAEVWNWHDPSVTMPLTLVWK